MENYEIESRIFISKEILENEYKFYYGSRKDEEIEFTYINFARGEEKTLKAKFIYRDALQLARSRSRDRRYKNYHFLLTL